MLNSDAVITATDHRLSSQLGNEIVILDTNAGHYWSLNKVGARIWELVQEPSTFKDIVSALTREYDVSREQCEREVSEVLLQMEKKGLVHVQYAGNGASRS